jgi:hypothetical protein
MLYFLMGLAALVLGLLLLRGFSRADITVLARQMRTVGGVAALVGAAAFMLRGMMSYAMPLAMLGSWLLWGGAPTFGRTQKSPGQASRIVTDHLEMELDHDTGRMRGRVLKGQFKGRPIESLSPSDLAGLWQECRFSDVQSATLIEAYLDNLHPNWRDDVQRDGGTGQGHGSGSRAAMSREEALDILGLSPGATEAEIRAAHRELMLKVHPDRGGSDYLAAKINMAKDVLLNG